MVSDDPIARLIREAGPRPSVPPERAERVRLAVEGHWRARVRSRIYRRRLAWMLPPAAAAAALSISILTPRAPDPGPVAVVELTEGDVSLDGEPTDMGQPVRSRSWVTTASRSRVALRLSSGTSLRLDEGTKLGFLAANRFSLQEGAVYVDSGPGASSVVIETPFGEARDVGTRFAVRTTADSMLVRVRDGSVRVDGARERLDAAQGEEVEIGRRGDVARRRILPHAREWDWVASIAPAFVLEGRSLGVFLDWVARETGLRVRFETDTLAKDASTVHLEGSIEGLSPREALDVVVPSTGLGYRIDGGTLFIENRS